VSKRQAILNRLRDTILPGITTGAGYNNTLQADSVHRGLREMDSLPDSAFPILFIARTAEERENLTGNQFLSKMQVVLIGYVQSSAGVDGAQEDLDDFIEDITKVLETDRTIGLGYVSYLEIKRVATDEGDLQSIAGFRLDVEIQYVTEGATP
jgi:hypothetical protein